LNETNNRFCIQYIFASATKEQEASCQFLINIYHDNPDKALHIFNEWFEGGKLNKEKMFEKYNFGDDKYEQELNKHKTWKEKCRITSTPVVLVNGYLLPKSYKIEDLKFIRNFLRQ